MHLLSLSVTGTYVIEVSNDEGVRGPALTQTNQGFVSLGGADGILILLAVFIVTKCCVVVGKESASMALAMCLFSVSHRGSISRIT